MLSIRVWLEDSLGEQFRQHARAKGFTMPANLLRQMVAEAVGAPVPKPDTSEPFKLAPAQATVCKCLDGGPLTIKELLRVSGLALNTIYNTVYRLQDLGHVKALFETRRPTAGAGAPSKVYELTKLGRATFLYHRDADAIQNRLNIVEAEMHAETHHTNMSRLHRQDAVATRYLDERSELQSKWQRIRTDVDTHRDRAEKCLDLLAKFQATDQTAAPAVSKEWKLQAEYEVFGGQTTYQELHKGVLAKFDAAGGWDEVMRVIAEAEEPARAAAWDAETDRLWKIECIKADEEQRKWDLLTPEEQGAIRTKQAAEQHERDVARGYRLEDGPGVPYP